MKITYELNLDEFKKYFNTIPDNIIYEEKKFAIVPKEYRKILYNNNNFLNMKTQGISLIKNGKEITRSLNNGLQYNNKYFIDLDTFDKEQRRKGYGTITSAILINMLLKDKLMPLWETTEENISSQKVAKKLGFQKIEKYVVYNIKI